MYAIRSYYDIESFADSQQNGIRFILRIRRGNRHEGAGDSQHDHHDSPSPHTATSPESRYAHYRLYFSARGDKLV